MENMKKRLPGRPKKENALTPAQKQAAYRLRLANKQSDQQQSSDFEALYHEQIALAISQAKQHMQNAETDDIRSKFFHDMQSLIDFRDSFKKVIKSNVAKKYKQVELF